MIPTVFGENQSLWDGVPQHGLIDLIDCISCKAVQTQDDESAEWELELKYPCSGQGASLLTYNKIIVAKANSWQQNQIFRIYSVIENIDQTLTVKAQHIFYDMANIPVKPFKVTSAGQFKNSIGTYIVGTSHFTLTTNIPSDHTDNDDWKIKQPTSLLAAVLDGDDSWKGQYPGDLVFNNYSVHLQSEGGADRGVIINYGVDLIDMEQEKNISEMITGILPYVKRSTTDSAYKKDDVTTHYVYGAIAYRKYANGTTSESLRPKKIEPMDLSSYFKKSDGTPSATAIKTMGEKVCKKLRIGEPKISLKLSYAYVGQDVRMFDKIRVKFPRLGIDTSAKVVKYKYDVLLERVEEVELGYARSSKYFRLMDASKLRKGLLSLDRIADQSIDDKKIARGGIGKGSIGKEAVETENVSPGAIDTNQLAGTAVTTAKLAKWAVESNNIGPGAVIAEKLYKHAVERDKINPGAVGADQIENNSIDVGKLKGKTAEAVTYAIQHFTQ